MIVVTYFHDGKIIRKKEGVQSTVLDRDVPVNTYATVYYSMMNGHSYWRRMAVPNEQSVKELIWADSTHMDMPNWVKTLQLLDQ